MTLHTVEGYADDNRPLDEIMVYDIGSSTWYNVTATGAIPSERVEFCTVVSSAPDGSSANIVLYGGWNLYAGHAYDDVYILSIPSFTWIQINDTGNTEAQLNGVIGRHRHQCELYKDRQMVVIGGEVEIGNQEANGQSCNASYPSIRVLDTVTYTWQTQFNPDPLPYEVPAVVYNMIGGRYVNLLYFIVQL